MLTSPYNNGTKTSLLNMMKFYGGKKKKNFFRTKNCNIFLIQNKDIDCGYEGESRSIQVIPFPMDRDIHVFHALFQYMFYTWIRNCTLIESLFKVVICGK